MELVEEGEGWVVQDGGHVGEEGGALSSVGEPMVE
jgi:hypothetical protein